MRLPLKTGEPTREIAALQLRVCDALEAAGFDADAIHFTLDWEDDIPRSDDA